MASMFAKLLAQAPNGGDMKITNVPKYANTLGTQSSKTVLTPAKSLAQPANGGEMKTRVAKQPVRDHGNKE